MCALHTHTRARARARALSLLGPVDLRKGRRLGSAEISAHCGSRVVVVYAGPHLGPSGYPA